MKPLFLTAILALTLSLNAFADWENRGDQGIPMIEVNLKAPSEKRLLRVNWPKLEGKLFVGQSAVRDYIEDTGKFICSLLGKDIRLSDVKTQTAVAPYEGVGLEVQVVEKGYAIPKKLTEVTTQISYDSRVGHYPLRDQNIEIIKNVTCLEVR